MSVNVWRITSTRSLALATAWIGSTFEPGRWHLTPPEGQPVVYAGSSRALCQLEKRVHCNGFQPLNQALVRFQLPDDSPLLDVRDIGLPDNWIDDEMWTREAGVKWRASGASLGLWVPSAVEPAELNILLNPDHPQYAEVSIVVERDPFIFDDRIFNS